LKFGFVGIGQAGNAIASQFWADGYRRVVLFNTTDKDMMGSCVPKAWHCVAKDYEGAGKDRNAGRSALASCGSEINELVSKRMQDVDFIFVCTSAGGGTGSGAAYPLVQLLKSYMMQKFGLTAEEASSRVGVIAVIPKPQEGSKVLTNARDFLREFLDFNGEHATSKHPMLLVENARAIERLPKNIAITQVNDNINKVLVRLFDSFNTISSRHSDFATFDPQDYASILKAGILSIGVRDLETINSDVDIARALKNNLTNNIMISDLITDTGTHAGLILLAGDKVMASVSNAAVNQAQESINSLLGGFGTDKKVVLHTGIYRLAKERVSILTIIGGLALSTRRVVAFG
jgi:cell division GTPase FtsZ